MNGPPIDARAIGAVLQQQEPRQRSYLLAQVLSQLNQANNQPRTPISLAANLGAVALNKVAAQRALAGEQAQQQGQNQALAQALQQAQGGMQSLPGTGVQLGNPAHPFGGSPPDPSGAMQGLVASGHPMGAQLAQAQLAQALMPKQPERGQFDAGDRIIFTEDGRPVGEMAKGTTPDAKIREEGDDRRANARIQADKEQFAAGEQNEFARLSMRLAADKENAGIKDANELQKEVGALRREFSGLAEVQDYKKVLPLLADLQTAPDTPAGDLSFTYGIAQISDPASAVKEGEQTLVLDAGSPLAKVFGSTRVNFGKGRLSPTQRQQLLEIAQNKVGKLQTAYDTSRNQFSLLTGKLGGDALDVVGEHFGEAFEQANAPKSGATQGGGKVRKYNPQTGKIE